MKEICRTESGDEEIVTVELTRTDLFFIVAALASAQASNEARVDLIHRKGMPEDLPVAGMITSAAFKNLANGYKERTDYVRGLLGLGENDSVNDFSVTALLLLQESSQSVEVGASDSSVEVEG